MLRQKWQKWQRSYPPRERTAGVLVNIEDSVDLGSCWEPRYWLGSSSVDNFYVDLEGFWTQTSPSISQHHCNSVAFHTMSKSKVCFWLGRPYKRIITSIDFSRAPLHILISDCCGEAARFDFIWFSPHNLYVCGVSWSFGMGTWLGPPMDQRGSRRVCGRIWLRSAASMGIFFWGGSCRWSVVMAGGESICSHNVNLEDQ